MTAMAHLLIHRKFVHVVGPANHDVSVAAIRERSTNESVDERRCNRRSMREKTNKTEIQGTCRVDGRAN